MCPPLHALSRINVIDGLRRWNEYVRMSTDSRANELIVWRKTWRNYFSPNRVQCKVVDFPLGFFLLLSHFYLSINELTVLFFFRVFAAAVVVESVFLFFLVLSFRLFWFHFDIFEMRLRERIESCVWNRNGYMNIHTIHCMADLATTHILSRLTTHIATKQKLLYFFIFWKINSRKMEFNFGKQMCRCCRTWHMMVNAMCGVPSTECGMWVIWFGSVSMM